MEPHQDELRDDLLDGAEAISKFYGWKLRRTYYLLERGLIPSFKIGKKWCARRSTSTAHIEKLESAVTSNTQAA